MKVEGIVFRKNTVDRKWFHVIDKDGVVSFQLKDFALAIRKKDLKEICENVEE